MATLHGLTFRVAGNDGPGAEVNSETVFHYRQHGDLVEADFRGGQVALGRLVGRLQGAVLRQAFVQVNSAGELKSGRSNVGVHLRGGLVHLVDEWQWDGGGKGTCVLEEVRLSGHDPTAGIRLATAFDIEPILALWRVVFPEYDDPARPQRSPRASLQRKLAFGDGLFWVAERDGERDGAVIGTVMAGYDGHRGWIYSLGVHPLARGGGIGRALAATAEAALATLGCPKVNLQVLNGNTPARAFWRRLGYLDDEVASLGKRLP
jgi:ribosomal protein S18 acetylase RimI-like enzyme